MCDFGNVSIMVMIEIGLTAVRKGHNSACGTAPESEMIN